MANRRFEMYQYRLIIQQLRMGDSDRMIAKSGLMGRKKVAGFRQYADSQGWLNPDTPIPTDEDLAQHVDRKGDSGSVGVDKSKAACYRDKIESWLETGVSAKNIYDALVRQQGYSGSYSSVQRYIQKLRPPEIRATCVLDFKPGENAQIDFGQGPIIEDVVTQERFKTWFFVMVLSWSRHQYVELVRDQSVETWLECHRRAFEWFCGVPKTLLIDNPKCAITKACYYDPVVQRSYADYAIGYGFKISPCPVAHPQKKGRVESGVKYVKRSFTPLRELRSLTDANEQLLEWSLQVAGNRDHGSTHEKPLSRFTETEQALLLPLPDVSPTLAQWVKAKGQNDCHVTVKKCRYSFPHQYIGDTLWVKFSPTLVEIYKDHTLIASHSRLSKSGEVATINDHLPINAQSYLKKDSAWCLKQADQVGQYCRNLAQKLLADPIVDRLRAVQGVIKLGEQYGHSRLDKACRRALYFEAIDYQSVKRILEQSLDQQPLEHTEFNHLCNIYQGEGRFCRNSSDAIN